MARRRAGVEGRYQGDGEDDEEDDKEGDALGGGEGDGEDEEQGDGAVEDEGDGAVEEDGEEGEGDAQEDGGGGAPYSLQPAAKRARGDGEAERDAARATNAPFPVCARSRACPNGSRARQPGNLWRAERNGWVSAARVAELGCRVFCGACGDEFDRWVVGKATLPPSSSSSSSSSSFAASSTSMSEPRLAWLPTESALSEVSRKAAGLANGSQCTSCRHCAHVDARCFECGHEPHTPSSSAPRPPQLQRSESDWSALGELLIDVLPCVVSTGYWREVGSNVGLCRATWRDKKTFAPLEELGRYGEHQKSRLHWACELGKYARALELLVEFRFDIETRDREGCTPLMAACWRGKADVARLLLDRDARRDASDEGGLTALYGACYYGHHDVARLLLDRGAAVDAASASASTPLFVASQEGHAAIVLDLLSCGAAVDARNTRGATPLIAASAKGALTVVELLLAAGASVDAVNQAGKSALALAVSKKRADVAALCVRAERGVRISRI